MSNCLSDIYKRSVEKGLYSSRTIRGFINYSLERIEELLRSGKAVILRAPPGIGKTAIPLTIMLSILKGCFSRVSSVIHVAPTRSLIDDIAIRIMSSVAKILGDQLASELIARQHGSAHETAKLIAPYTVTTFDTYLFNLYKLPTDEIIKIYKGSYGHYEVSRAMIFSALSFLDEIHMVIEEGSNMANAVISSFEALTRFRSSVILSTATLPGILLEKILNLINRDSAEVLDYEEYIRSKGVDEFYESESSKIFKPLDKKSLIRVKSPCPVNDDSFKELARRLLERVESGYRVAIVANTINTAKCIYRDLADHGNVILLHSRFTQEDRLAKLEKLRSGKSILLISTQVLEVGVDTSFDIMISQISPPSNLIQRMGRLARGDQNTVGEWAIFLSEEDLSKGSGVYSPNLVRAAWEILNLIISSEQKINWHLPKKFKRCGESFVGYLDILDRVWEISNAIHSLGSPSMYIALTKLSIDPQKIKRYLSDIGGFREENLCSLYIYEDEDDVSKMMSDTGRIISRSIPVPCKEMIRYAEKVVKDNYTAYLIKRADATDIVYEAIKEADIKRLVSELRKDPLFFFVRYLGVAIPSHLYEGGVYGTGLGEL